MKYKKYVGAWNPEQTKEIEGKIINIKEKAGKYETMVYVLEAEDSIFDIFGSEVLDNKIKNLCIEVGNSIKIIYNGKKKGKDAEYKDFDVYLGIED